MTESQLCCQLRKHGIREPADVAEAVLEGSGEVSVIRKREEPPPRTAAPAEADRGLNYPRSDLTLRVMPTASGAKPGNGTSEGEPDVEEFLRAADRLRERVAWHEAHIAEHRREVAELKGVLADHGVRWKKDH
jgi:hypothetical protein